MFDKTINTDVTMRDATPAGGARRFRAGDEILGRYVVESELGQGGMGVVYLCLDKVGGVKVAVKGLPPEVSHNSDEMEEVRRNFQLVCALRHPGIAGIRTLEREESTGLYYLVMDVAEGQNLTRWMREHAEPGLTPEKQTILRDIASALDYAHERRILHRDIKPGNVMIGPDGHAQVLDFGLAAQIRSSMSRVSMMVTSQSGTPAYKSPEQWKGRPQRAATDQYSLAVLAYRMISGELPFDGDDLTMLGRAVMNEVPEKVSGVPASVNAALQKALAKEPENRFESCAAFVAALSSDGRARTPAAQLKWIAASVILLTLAVVGGWWWRENVKSEELRVKNEAIAAERARQAEDRQKVEEAKRAEEEARLAAEKAEAERKAKLETERVAEENRKAEEVRIASEKAEAERKAKLEAERLAEEKRKAEEAARLAEAQAKEKEEKRKRVTDLALKIFRENRDKEFEWWTAMDVLEDDYAPDGELYYFMGMFYARDGKVRDSIQYKEIALEYFRKSKEMGDPNGRREYFRCASELKYAKELDDVVNALRSGSLSEVKKVIDAEHRMIGTEVVLDRYVPYTMRSVPAVAAKYCGPDVLEYLEQLGHDFNGSDNKGGTTRYPLVSYACSNTNAANAVANIKWFEKHGVDVSKPCSDDWCHGEYLTAYAATLQAFEYLMDRGAKTSWCKDTTLLHEIVRRDVEIELIDRVVRMIKNGDIEASIHDVDKHGRTALHACIEDNRSSNAPIIVKRLVENGLNAEARIRVPKGGRADEKHEGQMVLQFAAERYYGRGPSVDTDTFDNTIAPKVVGTLVDSGVDVDAGYEHSFIVNTPLYFACEKKNYQVMKVLLEKGADPNVYSKDGKTPLSVLVKTFYQWHEDCLRLLLQNGADANFGKVPVIHQFAKDRTLEGKRHKIGRVLDLLVKAGAKIDDCSEANVCTPLMEAADSHFVDMIDALVAAGADVNATSKDEYRKTALHYAKANLPTLKALLRGGADVNAVDAKGETVLFDMVAYTEGNEKKEEVALQCLDVLVRAGLDLNKENNRGEKVIDQFSLGPKIKSRILALMAH